MKTCSRCHKEKPLEDFHAAAHTKSGVYSWCRACAVLYQREVYKTLEGQLRHRVRAARGRAKRFKLNFNIDSNHLQELWELQDGRCAVSGMEFVLDDAQHGKQALRPSVDRIDPGKGYVKGNIRLVTTIVNFAINKWGQDAFLKMCESVVSKKRKRK